MNIIEQILEKIFKNFKEHNHINLTLLKVFLHIVKKMPSEVGDYALTMCHQFPDRYGNLEDIAEVKKLELAEFYAIVAPFAAGKKYLEEPLALDEKQQQKLILLLKLEEALVLNDHDYLNKFIEVFGNDAAELLMLEDSQYEPILFWLLHSNNTNQFRYFVNKLKLKFNDNQVRYILQLGIIYGVFHELVDILNIKLKDISKELCDQLIHQAARHGNEKVINWLLKHKDAKKAVITADENQQTPMHLAAGNGHLQLARKLASHADKHQNPKDLKNKHGLTYQGCYDWYAIKNNLQSILTENPELNDLLNAISTHLSKSLLPLLIDELNKNNPRYVIARLKKVINSIKPSSAMIELSQKYKEIEKKKCIQTKYPRYSLIFPELFSFFNLTFGEGLAEPLTEEELEGISKEDALFKKLQEAFDELVNVVIAKEKKFFESNQEAMPAFCYARLHKYLAVKIVSELPDIKGVELYFPFSLDELNFNLEMRRLQKPPLEIDLNSLFAPESLANGYYNGYHGFFKGVFSDPGLPVHAGLKIIRFYGPKVGKSNYYCLPTEANIAHKKYETSLTEENVYTWDHYFILMEKKFGDYIKDNPNLFFKASKNLLDDLPKPQVAESNKEEQLTEKIDSLTLATFNPETTAKRQKTQSSKHHQGWQPLFTKEQKIKQGTPRVRFEEALKELKIKLKNFNGDVEHLAQQIGKISGLNIHQVQNQLARNGVCLTIAINSIPERKKELEELQKEPESKLNRYLGLK